MIDAGIRQAAVVYLKNQVKIYWKAETLEDIRFSEADKGRLRGW
jgi:hypothetical protein